MSVRSSSLVPVHVPGTQYAPAQMTLAMVRAGLLQGAIPSTAVVQVVPGGDWLPAQQVVAECVDFQPTRAGGAMALVGLVPVLLLIGHIVLFGDAGVLWPKVLLGAGVVGLGVMWNTRLRTRSSGVLLRSPAFLVSAGAVLFACEVPALAIGIMDRRERAKIGVALSSANPCDFEGVSQLVDKDGTDEERSRATSRRSDCDAARYKQGCDQLVAHLDGSAVTPDDLAWLRAHGEAKAPDVVARLSAHALTDGSDPTLTQSDLGCSGRIWDRAVKALAITPIVWTKATAISDDMKAALVATGLSPESQAALAATAEGAAPSFAKRANSDDMKPGVTRCDLCTTLRVAIGPACTALEARYKRLVVREEGIASAKDAQEQAIANAQDARCTAIEKALNTCLDPCLDIDLFDPRADACVARCKARFPRAGCE